jgi:signal transduction histidine kinase
VRRELARAHALRTMLPVMVLLPLLAAALWFGAERALRPLSMVARELHARDPALLSPLPEERRDDEILPLVRALNDLLRRLSAALDEQRTFVADAAHELRSPLTALKLQLQLLERAADTTTRSEAGARLATGIERASRLVEQLLALARNEPDTGEQTFAPLQLGEVVREAIAEVVPLADARGVELGLEADDGVSVRGDADALRILARNLADNGVRYTPRDGRVDVSVRRDDGEAVIEVADTGPGVPVADRVRVFDRFFRRRAGDESGSGLGLAIVKAIAERHHGRVELGESPGGGLLARVNIPLGTSSRNALRSA